MTSQTAAAMTTQELDALQLSDEAMMHVYALSKSIAFFLIASYILVSFTQAATWWLTYSMIGHKLGVISVFARMLYLNAFWFVIVNVILLVLGWLGQRMMSPIPLFGSGVHEVFVLTLVIILGYFVILSYAFITHKTPLRTALCSSIKRYSSFVPVYALALLGLLLTSLIMIIVAGLHSIFVLLTLLILVLPWIAFSRLLFLSTAYAVRCA